MTLRLIDVNGWSPNHGEESSTITSQLDKCFIVQSCINEPRIDPDEMRLNLNMDCLLFVRDVQDTTYSTPRG